MNTRIAPLSKVFIESVRSVQPDAGISFVGFELGRAAPTGNIHILLSHVFEKGRFLFPRFEDRERPYGDLFPKLKLSRLPDISYETFMASATQWNLRLRGPNRY